ncbi:YIP1 family protein [Candidatus Bathyarchaeota archaeon]|nr:YIP1 family protein [Candidatus Bathyarchaeota archaeon]MBL7078900.1 YIP1 family protein [Candidatus Bathyarchaeota archaeon]
MSENKRGFLGKIMGLATSPRDVFSDIEEIDLKRGIAIILVIAVLSGWAGMTYFTKTELQLPGIGSSPGGFHGGGPMFSPGAQDSSGLDPGEIRSRLTPFIAVGGILGAVTRWLVPSVLILLAANIWVGKGSSKRMLAMTGFASAPLIIQQLLRVIDAYTISVADIASLTATQAASSGLLGRLVNQAFTVFNLFGVLTIMLTAVAVSVNYEATPRRAAFVTVLAYVVYMILRVYLPII